MAARFQAEITLKEELFKVHTVFVIKSSWNIGFRLMILFVY